MIYTCRLQQVKCERCHKHFARQGNLNKHRRTVKCGKDNFNFKCPMPNCTERRKTLSNLHSHGKYVHKKNYVLFKELLVEQARDRKAAKNASKRTVGSPSTMNTKCANSFEGFVDESFRTFHAELFEYTEIGTWIHVGSGNVNILPFSDFFRYE